MVFAKKLKGSFVANQICNTSHLFNGVNMPDKYNIDVTCIFCIIFCSSDGRMDLSGFRFTAIVKISFSKFDAQRSG